MNLNELHRKLIAAARAAVPADRVPYAFEKRIMARLASQPLPDTLTLWAQALWRAAVPCVAVVLLLGATSFFAPQETATTETAVAAATELTQDFENTLIASVDLSAISAEEAQ